MNEGLKPLVTRHQPWLLAQARNLCRNTIDAEDLVQETLLRFAQTFQHAVPDDRTSAAWLTTTLHNQFFAQLRKGKVRDRAKADPTFTGGMATPPEEAVTVYEKVTDEQFEQAVESLSEKLRATFELYAAGKQIPEIAFALGISEGTVAKRLFDARKKLRTFLATHFALGAH